MKVVTSQMTTDQTGGEAGELCVLHHLGVEGPLLLTLTTNGHTLELEETVWTENWTLKTVQLLVDLDSYSLDIIDAHKKFIEA